MFVSAKGGNVYLLTMESVVQASCDEEALDPAV
jgi:hypothetical protein